ncbi:hypothetical protein SFRURICE_009477 [Spodoptera frugiperda]|nr:hypothetical protein SFRURICE_009477 [Spodoptera frugiperda]
MSRSYCKYDEDWQRRKSILIRSLFHDLPILSPVTEEADDSFPPVRSYEPLEEPQRPYSPLPPLIIERVPKINKHDEPDEYYKKLLIKIKRIYRRLFILNRNLSSDEEFFDNSSITDDDDDFNTPLANKNDDNHDLNSPDNPLALNTNDHGLDSHIIDDINDPVDQAEEFNDLDDNKDDSQSQVNDNTNSNEENVRKSSNSNVSNGYRADSESIDTVIVDILNYTKSTNGETSTNTKEDSKASKELEEESESLSSEGEDESIPDKTGDGLSGNEKAGDNESSNTNEEDYSEELIVEEETNVSSTSNQGTNAMFITARRIQSKISNIDEINEQEMIEEESNDKSNTNQGVKTKARKTTEENIQESHQQEVLIEIRSEEEIRDKRITNQSYKSSFVTEDSNQTITRQEVTYTQRKEKQNRFEDLNKSRMNIKTANEDGYDNSSTSNEEWSEGEESESLEVEISVELSASVLEEIENAQELEGEGRRIAVVSPEIMDDDAVEVVSDIGSHYRQITTVALVHAAVPQDLPDIESQVYEGSPKSIILPVRRMKRTAAQAMLDRREDLERVGGNKEPRTEATTHSNDESNENIEEMRSHTRKLSQATNPEISQGSVSEESNEFIRNSHDVTDVTSPSQDGGIFNISKRKTSDDLGPVKELDDKFVTLIGKFVADIKHGKIRGSTNRVLAMVTLLETIITESQYTTAVKENHPVTFPALSEARGTPPPATLFLLLLFELKPRYTCYELCGAIRAAGRQVMAALPNELVIANVARRLLRAIRDENRAQGNQGIEGSGESLQRLVLAASARRATLGSAQHDLREPLRDYIAELRGELESSISSICGQAREHVHGDELILTYGASAITERFLRAAAPRKYKLILAEGPDPTEVGGYVVIFRGLEGALQPLEDKLLTTCCTPRPHLQRYLSHAMANRLSAAGVPVLALVPLYKLCPIHDLTPFNSSGSPHTALSYDRHEATSDNVHVYAPMYDFAPPDHVTLFITNLGGSSPSYMYRMLSELYDPSDYAL